MADGLGTAGGVISSISPALGAVPYVGPILSAAAGAAGGIMQTVSAKKQAEQAARVRQDALNTQKQPLRPEYLQKLRMQQMLAQQGLQGLPMLQEQLGNKLASDIRSVREVSTSGGNTLAAVSALSGAENDALTDLLVKDSQERKEGYKTVANTIGDIGDKQRDLEDIRDKQRTQGLTAASAFDNAATYNKNQGIKQILGAIGTGASGISALAIDGGLSKKAPATQTGMTTSTPGVVDGPDNQFYVPPMDNSSANPVAADMTGTQLSDEQAQLITSEMNALLAKGNLSPDELAQVKQYRDLLKGYTTQ